MTDPEHFAVHPSDVDPADYDDIDRPVRVTGWAHGAWVPDVMDLEERPTLWELEGKP